MDFADFVTKAATTDRYGDTEIEVDEAIRTALYGISGEAGSVVSEAKKWFRANGSPQSLGTKVSEEVGDLLWYIAALCRRLGLDLDEVANDALVKNAQIWTDTLPAVPTFDAGFPDDQRLLRKFEVRFTQESGGDYPIVRVEPLGAFGQRYRAWADRKHLGDPLNDNSIRNDGYRYHDVIHIAHAAVLGWSPVLRQISGCKRKHSDDTDRVEDGARAVAVEEGLSAFVFNYVEEDDFLANRSHLDWELIKHIRRVVAGLEVSSQPPVAWRRAYLQGFEVFRSIRDNEGGVVRADLDERTVTYIGKE